MPGSKPEDIQTVRIPFVGESLARGTLYSKDQRFTNCYFDVLKNSVTNKITYFLTKRPGLSQFVRPTGGAATARGFYSWRGDVYSCYGTQLYKNTTNLGVTLTTTATKVSFEATRPSSTTPKLAFTDGTSLVVIDTAGAVTVHNNKAITSSSVAAATVITTSSAHGLTTGNKVIIKNHTGSTPAINDTAYTVTVLSSTTFSIPVNVTVAGTGGTIGYFPAPNVSQLLYFDGYILCLKTDGSLHNCELDDPNDWDPTKFIVPIMENGTPIGITRQANFVLVFSDRHTQAFYNAANATGSPLSNYEQGQLQIGCPANFSIANEESFVTWVGTSDTGGVTVYKLQGLGNPKEIGDPTINRVLNAEKTSIASAQGHLIRIAGHIFYILYLTFSSRTFVYDYDLDVWVEWTDTTGTLFWPIVDLIQYQNRVLAMHQSNGWIYTLDPAVTQDDSVSFPVTAQFKRYDEDTNNRKFCFSAEIIGDMQTGTTPVLLQYSDDDFLTFSTARTLDLQYARALAKNLGNFRRRGWKISYTGSNPLRLEALQLKIRLGTD